MVVKAVKALMALKGLEACILDGFGAPILMYFGGSEGLLHTFLAGFGGLWDTILGRGLENEFGQ